MGVRLGFCGAFGKVGIKFLEYFSQSSNENVVLNAYKIIKEKNDEYQKVGNQYKSLFNNIKVITEGDKLEKFKDSFDVILDFSTPSATVRRALECSELLKPFVTGTTGFSSNDLQKLIEYAQTIPIIIAQNFTWGINFIFSILKNYTEIIPENYFVEVYESHGPQKVDAPSGTAKRIIEILNNFPSCFFLNKKHRQLKCKIF